MYKFSDYLIKLFCHYHAQLGRSAVIKTTAISKRFNRLTRQLQQRTRPFYLWYEIVYLISVHWKKPPGPSHPETKKKRLKFSWNEGDSNWGVGCKNYLLSLKNEVWENAFWKLQNI